MPRLQSGLEVRLEKVNGIAQDQRHQKQEGRDDPDDQELLHPLPSSQHPPERILSNPQRCLETGGECEIALPESRQATGSWFEDPVCLERSELVQAVERSDFVCFRQRRIIEDG